MWINIYECAKHKGQYTTTRRLGGQAGHSHWTDRMHFNEGLAAGSSRICERIMLIYKAPIRQRFHRTANRKLRVLHVSVTARRCMETRLFRFIYSGITATVMRNVSPWQNQGCTIWPWNRTATCTACLHRTAVQEAFQGICTDRFASAHPPDRKPGWFWGTQQTVHISIIGVQAQLRIKLKALALLNAARRPTRGSGWGTGGCRWTRRRRRCFQPELGT